MISAGPTFRLVDPCRKLEGYSVHLERQHTLQYKIENLNSAQSLKKHVEKLFKKIKGVLIG